MKPYYDESGVSIYYGDCREVMASLPAESVNCCVTSPPYWGLRDYGVNGQLGLEAAPEEYVANMVAVFREIKRVLRDDGTLWLNLGDSYAGSGKGAWDNKDGGQKEVYIPDAKSPQALIPKTPLGLKPKDLVGIPWRVAFALQADGWYLRQDIIWHKPNPMPESVTDRCTKAHEYIFLLSKSAQYWYDHEAIKDPCVSTHDAGNGFAGRQGGASHMPMSGGKGTKEPWTHGKHSKTKAQDSGRRMVDNVARARAEGGDHDNPFGDTRNKRSVWTVNTKPFKGAHFAVFPPELITPCILAGCPKGGTVIDPFGGSGTTAQVAKEHGRKAISIELNADYLPMQKKRLRQEILPL